MRGIHVQHIDAGRWRAFDPTLMRLRPGDNILKAHGGTLIGERCVVAETGVSFRLAMAAWTPTCRDDDRDGHSLIIPSWTDATAAMGSVS